MGGCACAGKVSSPEQEPPEVVRPGAISNAQFIHSKRLSIHDEYVVDDDLLGQGAFGAVHRVRSRASGKARAAKALRTDSVRQIQRCKREVDVMKSLDHPNIVKLVETFDSEEQTYLVMELCEGGQLLPRLVEDRLFSEQSAAGVMQQILRGVVYLHAHHFVHRDLKPENFLFLYDAPVSNNVLKIIDFGLACRCADNEVLKTRAGSPHYVAPEVIANKGYDKQCDMWSLGVVAYVLLCGYPPFRAETEKAIFDKVRKGAVAFDPKSWSTVSKEARSFVSGLLRVTPHTRPSAEKALGDRWLASAAAAERSPDGASLPDGLVENMRRYVSKDKFSKAVNHVIARLLDDAEVCDLRRAFEALDADGDGQLSPADLREGLRSCGLPEHELKEILKGMGANGNGAIGYTQFLAATLDRSQCMDDVVYRQAFNVFDWDGDGQISPQDLLFVLQDGQMSKALREESRAMFEAFDTDRDGSISFAEFHSILHQ